MDEASRTPRWLLATSLVLVLLVAAGLRLYRLPELPLGLHYDEAANGILASEIARGASFPIFIPSYTGKEPLFFYWTALWMKLLGVTPLALRLSAALAGLATVAATVWAIHELLRGQRDAHWVALLSAAFLATSFWHLVLSRYGFRAVTQPLLQALTVAALWRGLRRAPCPSPPPPPPFPRRGKGGGAGDGVRGLPWLLLAGLFCGLTAYTYLAARAFPVPLAVALLVFLIADRGRRRTHLVQLTVFVAAAALTLAPLAHYWATHPGSFLNRTQQVAAADWAQVWSGVRLCLRVFFLQGDPYIRFNLPHRPLFDPATAALALLGLGVALWQLARFLRKDRGVSAPLHLASSVFLLVSLPVMLLPSALATGDVTPSNLRAAGLLPFVYVFPALGLSALASRVLRRPGGRSSVVARWSLVVLLLIVLSPTTGVAYFRHWAPSAALYYAADGDLADVAAHLNASDLDATTPYVASIHYRHPTLAFLAQEYGRVRWLTGGRTVVAPAEGDGLLIFPRSASKDLAWVESLLPADSLAVAPPGPDGEPAFHAYRVGASASLTATHAVTADLGHAAWLLGYDVIGTPRSGESVEVAIWWRVSGKPDRGDYGAITRLADPWGSIWGEAGPFHYPSEQWTPGEVVVDHLSIPIAAGAPPGDYLVRFSLYSAQAQSALPVLDDAGRYAGIYVELPLRLDRAREPPPVRALGIRTRLDEHADGVTLLGYNLNTASARPGERLHATLFWRADGDPLPEQDVIITLGDTTLYQGEPAHGSYPFPEWAPGEIVADQYDPRLPREMLPGDYPLRLTVSDVTLDLGIVTVERMERIFKAPDIRCPLTARLGDRVELLGYGLSADVAAPGDTLALTLYWRALIEMDESYTVFTHLVGPDGSMTGQRDNPPVSGSYPTSLWLAGEVVTDTYEIPVRADAPPGEHRLEIGMYVAETGTRLPVTGTDDDAILLQMVTVSD